MPSPATFRALVAAWALAVVASTGALAWYSGLPGQAATPPQRWPANAPVQLDAHRPTLLGFLHPQCPCSKATLDNLQRLVARSDNAYRIYLMVLAPRGQAATWVHSSLWEQASQLHGVTVIDDVDGKAMTLFQVATSGQFVGYQPDGHLFFNSGITPGRAHEGDSFGLDALIHHTDHADGAVFGCPMCNGGNRP